MTAARLTIQGPVTKNARSRMTGRSEICKD